MRVGKVMYRTRQRKTIVPHIVDRLSEFKLFTIETKILGGGYDPLCPSVWRVGFILTLRPCKI